MATLTVGINQVYSSIAAAVAAAQDGDTVAVSAGTYSNDFAVIHSRISLVSVGGLVTMVATRAMASGQGLLTVGADATVDGFVLQGAHAADGTAAGIVYQAGALTLQNSLVTGNQTGLVSGTAAAGTIVVTGSEFAGNGVAGNAATGNLSVGAIKALTVQNSYLHDAAGGDEVRSLAATTTVTGNRIADNAGSAASAIDLPNGGTAVIQNNVIEKGAASSTAASVQFGGGTLARFSTLSITGNVFVSDRSGATLLKNVSTGAATVSGNQMFGYAAVVSGLAVSSGNTVPTSRPAVSTAALVAAPAPVASANPVLPVTPTPVAPTPVAPTPVAPALASPLEYGRAGAVVASGRVLTVGAGGGYATLGAAVAASRDGDTIDVAAGTYVDDTAVINHKVVIQGVGGLARFVDTKGPANGAAFVTTTDATFRNVEIFGASTPGGVAAGIHDAGGNLTIVNSTIHDNQAGVVADTAAGTLGIYDTEIAANGTADGRGGNLQVAEIGTLTLRNDFVHGGVAGAEIASAADNTVIDGVRVSQGAQNTAAPVALPDGGRVTISNSAIEKGAAVAGGTVAAAVVLVGGGPVYAGSSVAVSGGALISDVTAVRTAFVTDAANGPGVSVGNVTFVRGAVGSVQAQNATSTGAVATAVGSVNTASLWGAAGAPVAASLLAPVVAAGPAVAGQLVLRVSEAAWHGDAQFTLTVDGAAVAGVLTATASHAAGQSQAFTVAGAFAPGPHTVGMTFVNNLTGSDGGRALYVDGMTFNGQDTHQVAALPADGTVLLSTGAATQSTVVTVNLSEDAWHGDAMAFITIDGKVQGGVQTVGVQHGAGTQAMSFLLDLAPGAHTAGVTLLNGVSGQNGGGARDLHVDSVDVAGQHYAAAAAALTGGVSSSTFAFTTAPATAANGALFVTAGLPQSAASLVPVA